MEKYQFWVQYTPPPPPYHVRTCHLQLISTESSLQQNHLHSSSQSSANIIRTPMMKKRIPGGFALRPTLAPWASTLSGFASHLQVSELKRPRFRLCWEDFQVNTIGYRHQTGHFLKAPKLQLKRHQLARLGGGEFHYRIQVFL